MRQSEIQGHWLSKRARSPYWHVTYFDERKRQTKRFSTGTIELAKAELCLAEYVIKGKATKQREDVGLATLFLRYYLNHANALPSKVQSKIALRLWASYWEDASVADLSIDRQEAFVAWLKAKGYKNSYVSRVIAVGRAALTRAWKRQEIKDLPFIHDERDRSDEGEKYVLNKDEMRALLDATKLTPHLRVFVLISINTLARPEAVLDLCPAQVNLDARIIDLNPKGRRRTKKSRPIVPMTEFIMPFLGDTGTSRFVNWYGAPIKSIKKGFATCVARAGLDKRITPYCLRHTMAVYLRSKNVPLWEVQGWLGHKVGGVTEKYARFSPSHLSAGRAAIDSYMKEVIHDKSGNSMGA